MGPEVFPLYTGENICYNYSIRARPRPRGGGGPEPPRARQKAQADPVKFFHLSDLHLGKRLGEFSLLEDQRHILGEILRAVDAERPDAVLIAGDVYDKSVPPVEAVQLFDDFLVRLAARGLQTFVISGNHDSPERIAFGGRLMAGSGVQLSPVYERDIAPVTLADEFGPVDVFMLPFVRPAHVRRFFPEAGIDSYTAALEQAVSALPVDPARRSVLITHQFVTGALRSESEDVSVGGADNVDARVFAAFDYVALGHLHRPQSVGRPTLRYCGTPLKYSLSEAGDEKSLTVVELGRKGEVDVRTMPLRPLRELREIRGTYMELADRRAWAGTATDDYLHVVLTDEEDVPEAINRLRAIYPNIVRLEYDNRRTRAGAQPLAGADAERRRPLELFEDFYRLQNNAPLSAEQRAFVSGLIERIWEDEA